MLGLPCAQCYQPLPVESQPQDTAHSVTLREWCRLEDIKSASFLKNVSAITTLMKRWFSVAAPIDNMVLSVTCWKRRSATAYQCMISTSTCPDYFAGKCIDTCHLSEEVERRRHQHPTAIHPPLYPSTSLMQQVNSRCGRYKLFSLKYPLTHSDPQILEPIWPL